MYLVHIYFEHPSRKGTITFDFSKDQGKIKKWTFISADSAPSELLPLIALACEGAHFLNQPGFDHQGLFKHAQLPSRLEFIFALHPHDTRTRSVMGGGLLITGEGRTRILKKGEHQYVPSNIYHRIPKIAKGNAPYFMLGYGPELVAHHETDDFNFTDPCFRLRRFLSLFTKQALITDPVALLTHIHYRGIQRLRIPPKHGMERIAQVFREHLSIDTGPWLEKSCDFSSEWKKLSPWQQRAALPALDAARHLIDAFPKCRKPLDMPGLILFNGPDHFCTEEAFSPWIMLMDQMLPEMQFIVTLFDRFHLHLPDESLRKSLSMPEPRGQQEIKKRTKIPKGSILFIDIDSHLPNLALMKLSRYFKEQGRTVILCRKERYIRGVDAVYASCVFSFSSSRERAASLHQFYGGSLILGGSGVDIHKRLPGEIEKLPADYALYPELEDRGIGFITRGCPFHCPFCIVPQKEGAIRQVSDIETLLPNKINKLILLDDNILAHPMAVKFLEEMAMRRLQVNFTQSLDIRFADREKARLLRLVDCRNTKFTRQNYYFSLNDTQDLEQVRDKYQLFGFSPADNVEFICMYGYNTNLAEDVERFRFLKTLPGAYVFVQEYRPLPNSPRPELSGFFDGDADKLIDELIKIEFRQNMKSMERYYRWVSKRYVQQFGRLHMRLVDTIFRYNYRHRRGQYIATMAGTTKEIEER